MTELRECPFCGGGETRIDENRLRPTMTGQGSLVSVEIHHWCPASEGQPRRNHMVKVGRDRAFAISAWNRRADDWQPIETAPRDGTVIDLWFAGKWNCRMPGFVWRPGVDFWHSESTHQCFNHDPNIATHWRPLPKGPGG